MGGSSWLSAVKRALKSRITGGEIKSEQEKEYHKTREKRRWIFNKPPPYERAIERKEDGNISSPYIARTPRRKSTDQRSLGSRLQVFEDEVIDTEQRRAFAVAMATSAVATAVATAQAAVKIIRLASPSIISAENYAAVVIQAAFRGYLARRALQALKGVVKLQAFVRGCIVRKRSKTTLQCMQSLLRVQSQVCNQRKRLSTDSAFSPFKQFYQVSDMNSNSRHSTSSVTPHKAHQHKSKEAYHKREHSRAYAFPQQVLEGVEPRQVFDFDTSGPRSPIFPRNQTQNLLVNSLASPHRSRIRTLKAHSREKQEDDKSYHMNRAPFNASPLPSYMAATRSRSAPRQR